MEYKKEYCSTIQSGHNCIVVVPAMYMVHACTIKSLEDDEHCVLEYNVLAVLEYCSTTVPGTRCLGVVVRGT